MSLSYTHKYSFVLFYDFSVDRILSPYARDTSDRSFTSLTAADVPWPDVIETCINTLLSWLHTISDVKNVYYFSQDVEGFKLPTLWTEALTETIKLVESNSSKIGLAIRLFCGRGFTNMNPEFFCVVCTTKSNMFRVGQSVWRLAEFMHTTINTSGFLEGRKHQNCTI